MPDTSNTLHAILKLQNTGSFSQLIRALKRLLNTGLSEAERAEAQYHLGVALTDKGDYGEGLRLLEQARATFAALRMPEKAAVCLAEVALNHHRRGGDKHQQQALDLLDEAGAVLKQVEGDETPQVRDALAKIAFYLAVVCSQTGAWENAYHFYQDAYELYQENPAELAKVFDSLGKYYSRLGRPTLARLYYERSIEKKDEVGNQFGLCISFNNLGRLYVEQGRFLDAQHYFQQALTLAEAIGNHHGVAMNLNELGRVALHLQDVEGAEEYLRRCLEHSGRKYSKTRALAHKNLAKACLFKGKPAEGLPHIKRSLRLFQRLEDSEGKGIAKRMQGRLLKALKEYDKATRALLFAITMFRQVHKPRGVALTLIDLADVQHTLQQSDAAFDSLKQALQIAESIHDDLVVQRVQDELHRIAPMEALKIAIQRQVGKEAAAFNASLMGHQEWVTVLFSDIRGFSDFSSRTPAREVVDTLNDYFWAMTHVVMERNGYVDKFIGDGLMAIFRGDDKGYHPYRAVSAGLKMLECVEELNRERQRLGLWEIRIRIGIHTGEAIIGNIGSYEKMDYTAIGSTVNLAQRLEAHARLNTVLISKDTYQYVSGHFTCFARLPFIPKGFQSETESWEVTGARDLVRFRPVFVEHGIVLDPQARVIALDVGSRTLPGVIDHHHNSDEAECTASLIYRHPHLVLDHSGIDDIKEMTLILPASPDFDAILSAYFTQHLLEKGVLSGGARELSEYAKAVEFSNLAHTDMPWNTPYGVLQGIFEKDRCYCEEKGLSQETSNRYCLQRGFYLMEYLCLKIAEGLTLDAPNLFQEEYPFEQERKLMREISA